MFVCSYGLSEFSQDSLDGTVSKVLKVEFRSLYKQQIIIKSRRRISKLYSFKTSSINFKRHSELFISIAVVFDLHIISFGHFNYIIDLIPSQTTQLSFEIGDR